jgi:predicted DsbA family dithiol-disulfide isomerase
MRIDIIFDTICPWCFVGKKRLEETLKARSELIPEIFWHAFQLNPDMQPEGVDHKEFMKRKFGDDLRSQRLFGSIVQAGESLGIDFRFDRIKRTPNTVDSHRLVRFAAQQNSQSANETVETLFNSYFLEGRDIGNRSVLIDIGISELAFEEDELRRYLYSDENVSDIGEQNARAHRLGISGVPAFIFDGQFSISGAQDANVINRIIDISEEKRRELFETGTQPV